MHDILCTYPLSSDLFTQSLHPTSPLIALGLASGHVQLNALPPLPNATATSTSPNNASANGYGTIDTAWRTRRHKGSCRALCFSNEGLHLYSAGTDGVVKVADTSTGKVVSKIAVPLHDGEVDAPALLEQLNSHTLLLATDSRALHFFDVREDGKGAKGGKELQGARPAKTIQNVHADYVTSISRLPSAGGGEMKHFLSTGGDTVAVVDVRKGVVLESEEMGDELLSSAVVAGKAIVGGQNGTLRIWDVGNWDEETVVKSRGEQLVGLEVLVARSETEDGEGTLAMGFEDGIVRFADVGSGKGMKGVKVREEEIKHDEMEGVVGLGWVQDGRLISGGGQSVKIWEERVEYDEEDEEKEEEEEEEEDEDEEEEGQGQVNGVDGETPEGEGGSSSGDGDSSSEEERPKKRRKKKKRKGKGKSGKSSGILGFKGLD